MKWICPKCGDVKTEDPRKGRRKAHCECSHYAWYQTFVECVNCKKEFHCERVTGRRYCSRKCHYGDPNKINGKLGNKYPHTQRAKKRRCKICKKIFRAVSDYKERKQKYCSKRCWGMRNPQQKRECRTCGKFFLKRIDKENPGIYCSKNCYDKDPKSKQHRKGIHAPRWKGKRVSYSGLHKWVAARLGKPKKCEHCGKEPENPHDIHWASRDHKYHRHLADWIRLCSQCHKEYDLKMGHYQATGRRKGNITKRQIKYK